jgi:hypothetical protein
LQRTSHGDISAQDFYSLKVDHRLAVESADQSRAARRTGSILLEGSCAFKTFTRRLSLLFSVAVGVATLETMN